MVIVAEASVGHEKVPNRGWPKREGFAPPDNTIVLQGRDGGAASCYGDSNWRYGKRKQGNSGSDISFDVEDCDVPPSALIALIDEARWVLYLYLFDRPGVRLAKGTAYHRSRTVIAMVMFCFAHNLEVRDLFARYVVAYEFLAQSGSGTPKSFLAIVECLRALGSAKTGISCMTVDEQENLRAFKKQADDNINQHPPLPTRIYTNLIKGLENDINEYERVEHEIQELASRLLADSSFGRGRERQAVIVKGNGADKKMEVQQELAEVMTAELATYLERRGHGLNVYGLTSAISEMQIVCKLTVHVFSGMRDEEANFLPYDCYQPTVLDGRTFHILTGYTTKFTNGVPTGVFWVTSTQSLRAVELAKRIADIVRLAQEINFPDESTNERERVDAKNVSPLFLSTGYFQINKPTTRPKIPNQPGQNRLGRFLAILERYDMVIQKDDVDELKQIDPYRPWENVDEYKIGKVWPLRTHQLRRSLALYATSSGLVGYTSLRRQLKQLRVAMAEYYANGSAFAKNIIDENPKHMARVYQTAQIEAEFLGFIRNMVDSPEKSFGGFGTWVERNLKESDGTITLETRKTIDKRFERGEMAYRETIFGGCGKVGACDRRSMRHIIACPGCAESAIKLSRLNIVIEQQTILVQETPQQTIEYKTEESILNELVDYRKKIMKKGVK